MFVKDAADHFGEWKGKHIVIVGRGPIGNGESRIGAGDEAARADQKEGADSDQLGETVEEHARLGWLPC